MPPSALIGHGGNWGPLYHAGHDHPSEGDHAGHDHPSE